MESAGVWVFYNVYFLNGFWSDMIHLPLGNKSTSGGQARRRLVSKLEMLPGVWVPFGFPLSP